MSAPLLDDLGFDCITRDAPSFVDTSTVLRPVPRGL
jgi:hypothetical protein